MCTTSKGYVILNGVRFYSFVGNVFIFTYAKTRIIANYSNAKKAKRRELKNVY